MGSALVKEMRGRPRELGMETGLMRQSFILLYEMV